MAIILPLWVYASFLLSQVVLGALISILILVKVPLADLNQTIATTVLAALIYSISLVIVIGLPRFVLRRRTTRQDVALVRPPIWTDFVFAPAGLVAYFVLSFLFIYVANIVPSFNPQQIQDTGFNALSQNYEYVLAFLTLVIIAPIAEETLFRGYLLGKLIKVVPVWLAVLVTSALFGFIHGAWNVGIDTFALSIVLSIVRLKTGSLWASMLIHMAKNGIAFYLLFINPLLLHTLGG